MPGKTNVKRDFFLSNEGIWECVKLVEELPADKFDDGLDKKALLLRIEEGLLRFQDRFGAEAGFSLFIRRFFGRYTIRLTVAGEYFNPLQSVMEDDDYRRFAQNLSAYGTQFEHSYADGKNILAASFRKKPKISGVLSLLLIILVGAAIVGIGLLLPENIRAFPAAILADANTIILGLISFISLPVVFFSVIEGITACGSVQTLGQRGTKTIKTFLLVSLAALLVTCVASCFIFPLNFESGASATGVFDAIRAVVVNIFPTNFVKPFSEGNMLQVVLIGAAIGCAILLIGEKSPSSASPIQKVSRIFSTVMSWICKLIPIALACMIASNFLDGSFANLLKIWPEFLLLLAVDSLILFVTVLIASKKLGMSLGKIIGALAPAMIIALSTSSSVAAFAEMKKSLTEKFRAKDDYASFALPMSLSFFNPGDTVMHLVVLLFLAYLGGVEVSAAWIFCALLLNYVFAIASPPVPGGSVAVMTILFQAQGIPESLFSLGFISLMLLDYITVPFRVGMMTVVSACEAEALNLREPCSAHDIPAETCKKS